MAKFELYVSPFEKETLRSYYGELEAASDILEKTTERIRQEIPQEEGESELDWLVRIQPLVVSKCPAESQKIYDIHRKIEDGRSGLYDSLAEEFEGLMHNLVSEVSQDSKNWVFIAKLGGKRFFDCNDFFDAFDAIKEAQPDMTFDLYGPLNGKYSLFKRYQEKELCDLECEKDFWGKHWFSPIKLEIELPDKYSSIAEKAFERLKEKYGSRVVPVEELKECRTY